MGPCNIFIKGIVNWVDKSLDWTTVIQRPPERGSTARLAKALSPGDHVKSDTF